MVQVKSLYDPLQQFKMAPEQKFETFLIPALLRRIEQLKKEAEEMTEKKHRLREETSKRARYDFLRYRF